MAQGPQSNIVNLGRLPPTAGGSGPDDPTVEGRLARLEAAADDIRKELQAIRIDLARLDGKLSNVPTSFQLLFMQAGLILAIFAAAFGLLKLAAPH
jgi:hypothetical protein